MQKAHLPHFRPVSALQPLLISWRAVATSVDSSNIWIILSLSAILFSFSATILSFSATILSFSTTILSFSTTILLNSLTKPKYQLTIWKKQVIYKLSNMQQGLTVLSNKVTSFDCCWLGSTRSCEASQTCDRMSDILTFQIYCTNNINGNALSGYQESNLVEMGGNNLVHNDNVVIPLMTSRVSCVTLSIIT